MDRRTTLKWVFAASAAVPLLDSRVFGDQPPGARPERGTQPDPSPQPQSGEPRSGAVGYGTDPDLGKVYHPGDLWPLTLSPSQRHTAAVLCDVILPGDDVSPSASSVGVVDFLDEWVSAPYPRQQSDRPLLLDGLAWMDAEATRRFAKQFAALDEGQRLRICDDICNESAARPEFAAAATFFARYRDLTAGGFYSTPEGRRDIGYIGNVPRATFDGPPLEVLRKLGLAP